MPIPQSKRRFSRRDVVRGALGLGAGALALSACGSSSDDKPAGSTDSTASSGSVTPHNTVALPKYIPYTELKPDLPALDNGTSPYFAKYPAKPPTFSQDKPGDGSTIKALTIMNAIPKSVGSNHWWKAVNDALGANIDMIGTPIGGYSQKFSTTIAGGDLPDVVTVLPSETSGLPALLKAKFQDLSEFLAGDAIADYPGLANIPTYAWKGAVYNNGIYFLPIHRFSLYRCYLLRSDLVRAAGLDPQPKSGEDVTAILRALTNEKKHQWATASIRGLVDLYLEMCGAANSWTVKDGKFTQWYTTDEFRRALSLATKSWKDGLVHPDAFTPNVSTQVTGLFTSGVAPFLPATASWAPIGVAAKTADPNEEVTAFTVPKWDGGGWAKNRLSGASPYMAALKKADTQRIQTVLKVLDLLAAPWGTAENILIKNGVKGWDYTVNEGGTYEATDNGKVENIMPVQYSSSPALVHYSSDPDMGRAEYESEKAAMSNPAPNPTVGLDSATAQQKYSSLSSKMWLVEADVIQGRKSLDDWDKAVATWRSEGGDQITKEYEQSYQEVNS